MNKQVVALLDPRFEFVFEGLDVEDPKEELEADIKMMSNFMTIDEIRVKRGMKPLGPENGGNVVANSMWMQNKNAEAMAKQQEEQNAQQGQGGEDGSGQEGDQNPGSGEEEVDEDEANPFEKAFNTYLDTIKLN